MPELTGHMLHFAYGDDLPHAEFLRLCPGADWFGPARLEGFRLIFNRAGRPNVIEKAGSEVWGALWLVPAKALTTLDAQAAKGFERTTRRIVSPAGPRTEATIYLSLATDEAPPTRAQVATLLAAARECRLPGTYVSELKSIKTAVLKTS